MVVGTGSSATRIFIDKLANELNIKFKKSKIKLEYQYLGKTYTDAAKKLSNFTDSSFDSYLIFSPKDTSSFNGYVAQGYFSTSDVIWYHQNFEVSFYVVNKREPVWKTLLDVNTDINEIKVYSMIVNYIYKAFKANGYIH